MSVLRQMNLLGQQRVDVPTLRALESSICADFDLLAGQILAGFQPVVISGFDVVSAGVSMASELQLHVAGGTVVHYFATDSGSLFTTPSGRVNEALNGLNTRVRGAFTPGQMNYVGLDFLRQTLDSSRDSISFLDADTHEETVKTVPVSRVLDYRICISTVPFDTTPNIAPIAKVLVDAIGQISSITDARSMMFRLGRGGTVPSNGYMYPWPQGRATSTTFTGGDKAVDSFKTWCDAVMTRFWELGGGENWYSPTADRNVQMVFGSAAFISTGLPFEWVAGNLHWQGVKVVFDNSSGSVNTVTNQTIDAIGLTDLAEGQCIYIDLDRTQNATVSAQKAVLATLGVGAVPGSRFVLAWRPTGSAEVYVRGLPNLSGSWMAAATPSTLGAVRLCQTAPDPAAPLVAIIGNGAGALGYRQAMAGGVSRGSSDFVGGAGDLMIGGNSNDRHVLVGLNMNRNLKISYPVGPGAWDTRFEFEYPGILGLPTATATPTPPLGGEGVITAKVFVRTIQPPDLTGTGEYVDQVCVMWRNGRVTVIAESDPWVLIT